MRESNKSYVEDNLRKALDRLELCDFDEEDAEKALVKVEKAKESLEEIVNQ